MFVCNAVTEYRHVGRRQTAVSLMEVLLVIAIVAFMLALLVPGLSSARERARRVVCANNLRQWGTALQCYRDEHNDYLPKEGTYLGTGILKDCTWYNALPPYLGLPSYRDFTRDYDAMNDKQLIRELPNIHVWICPSKNLTGAYKSGSGKNQFHYGMNQVLDGLGNPDHPSSDTPGFLDMERRPGIVNPDPFLAGRFFDKKPNTVFMFDIAPNSPAGTPRAVATMYQRAFPWANYRGKYHGDYANILYLNGSVANCKTDDLVTDRDFRHGDIIWDNPRLYWGYPPP